MTNRSHQLFVLSLLGTASTPCRSILNASNDTSTYSFQSWTPREHERVEGRTPRQPIKCFRFDAAPQSEYRMHHSRNEPARTPSGRLVCATGPVREAR